MYIRNYKSKDLSRLLDYCNRILSSLVPIRSYDEADGIFRARARSRILQRNDKAVIFFVCGEC